MVNIKFNISTVESTEHMLVRLMISRKYVNKAVVGLILTPRRHARAGGALTFSNVRQCCTLMLSSVLDIMSLRKG